MYLDECVFLKKSSTRLFMAKYRRHLRLQTKLLDAVFSIKFMQKLHPIRVALESEMRREATITVHENR